MNIAFLIIKYRNNPKFSDRMVWQTVEQSDQGLYCLPFYLHILDKFLYGKNLFV